MNTHWRAALAALAAVATASCAALHPGGESPAAPPAPDTASPYQLIQEPERGYAAIYALLDRARTSIRMTMYEMNDPAATSALIAARRRGVDVRVLLDTAFHGRNTNADAYTQLAAAGVNVRWAPPGIIYHQKTITIDNVETALSTGNLDARWYPTSRDAWILDTNSTDIAAITDTFDTDDNPAPSGPPRPASAAPALLWSPAARATFLQHLDAASRSIEVTTEELTDRAIINALEKAARRGVTCRIVLTASPDTTRTVGELAEAGCAVHEIPDGPDQLYIHEKMLLTDRSNLIIGSHNLSTASLLENRELSLLLDTRTASTIIGAVETTFETDYARTTSRP